MIFVPKPSWDQGILHGLPGRPAAPGVVRSVLFLLIDHSACRIQHVNQTWSLNQQKNQWKKETFKKRGKKCETLCSLLSLICGSAHFRSSQPEVHFLFWGWISLFLSINQVECRDVVDFKFKRSVGCPLPVVDWAETVLIPESRQLSSVRSDLVWWINLIVSLWTSLSLSTVTMIVSLFDVSLRSFSVYVAVSQN